MCRNIRPLFNYQPAASEAEIRAASEQFVRKVSGFKQPSAANRKAFDGAVIDVSRIVSRLLGSLVTTAPPRDRAAELAQAHARALRRFG